MDKKYIIMAIVVLVIIYFIVNQLLVDKAVAESDDMFKANEADEGLSTLKGKIREGVLSDFAYSFWIYVEGWNSGEKNIIEHGVDCTGTNSNQRKIYLENSINNLKIKIPIQSDTANPKNCGTTNDLTVNNIPLQRWVHVVVTAHNRTLDVYMNGKMVKSNLMAHVPHANKGGSDNIKICNAQSTYDGKFSRFSYHEKALNPRDVREIYAKGPEPTGLLGGLLGKYKIKLLFMKGSDTVSDFSI